MGSRFKFADALRLEESTAAFIPYSSQVTRTVVKLANGDYVQTLRLQGAAHESADVLDLNVWHAQLNGFLRNIASRRWCMDTAGTGVTPTPQGLRRQLLKCGRSSGVQRSACG